MPEQQDPNQSNAAEPEDTDAASKALEQFGERIAAVEAEAEPAGQSDVASRQLPRYRCHKEVYAVKIVAVSYPIDDDKPTQLHVVAPFEPISVDRGWVARHHPQPGGYVVIYNDGYMSFSPAKAFEEGYTRIEG